MPSLEQWRSTWAALGVASNAALLDAYGNIVGRYSEPHRKYHTLRHLDECFAKLEDARDLADHLAEVELALWFHDAIYESRSSDNEARSAKLAESQASAAGVSPEVVARIRDLILATRHTESPESVDEKILVDVDLSILGARPDRFDEYERQVREEYSWVPEILFKKERTKILKAFLSRPAIFSTPSFRERHEAQARANMLRSLDALGG